MAKPIDTKKMIRIQKANFAPESEKDLIFFLEFRGMKLIKAKYSERSLCYFVEVEIDEAALKPDYRYTILNIAPSAFKWALY